MRYTYINRQITQKGQYKNGGHRIDKHYSTAILTRCTHNTHQKDNTRINESYSIINQNLAINWQIFQSFAVKNRIWTVLIAALKPIWEKPKISEQKKKENQIENSHENQCSWMLYLFIYLICFFLLIIWTWTKNQTSKFILKLKKDSMFEWKKNFLILKRIFKKSFINCQSWNRFHWDKTAN